MKINEKIDANLCILPESQGYKPYYLEGATILMKLSSMKMIETRSQKMKSANGELKGKIINPELYIQKIIFQRQRWNKNIFI